MIAIVDAMIKEPVPEAEIQWLILGGSSLEEPRGSETVCPKRALCAYRTTTGAQQ